MRNYLKLYKSQGAFCERDINHKTLNFVKICENKFSHSQKTVNK